MFDIILCLVFRVYCLTILLVIRYISTLKPAFLNLIHRQSVSIRVLAPTVMFSSLILLNSLFLATYSSTIFTRQRNADAHIINLMQSIRPQIELQEQTVYESFEPVSFDFYFEPYTTSLLYWVKVKYDLGFMQEKGWMHVKVQIRSNGDTVLMTYQKVNQSDELPIFIEEFLSAFFSENLN